MAREQPRILEESGDHAARLRARIADTALPARRKAVCDLAIELGQAELAALPWDLRLELLEHLADARIWGRYETARDLVYAACAVEPAFATLLDRRARALAEKLKREGALARAGADWPGLSEAERLAVLDHVARQFAALFEARPVAVAAFDAGPVTMPEGDAPLVVAARLQKGQALVNRLGGALAPLPAALAALLPLLLVAWQRQMVAELKAGAIARNDDRLRQALLLEINLSEFGFVASGAAFDSQPLMRAARRGAALVLANLGPGLGPVKLGGGA